MSFNLNISWDEVEAILLGMIEDHQYFSYAKARALYFVRDKKWSNQETAEFIYNELFGLWEADYDFITSQNGILVAIKNS